MRKAIFILGITCVSASSSAGAQPPADCTPSAFNIPGAPYPCVLPDSHVMFPHSVYFESPGTAREWLTSRRCLREFAPRWFR